MCTASGAEGSTDKEGPEQESAKPSRQPRKASGRAKPILEQSASEDEAEDAYEAPSKPQAARSFYQQVSDD